MAPHGRRASDTASVGLHLQAALLACLLFAAATRASSPSQTDEDLIFEEEGILRTRREVEVSPVEAPEQEEEEAPSLLTRVRRQFAFFDFGTSDDEDVIASSGEEGSGGEQMRIYRAKVHVLREWRSSLGNSESSDFISLARELETNLKVVIRPISGDKSVKVSSMSRSIPGKVLATVDINYTGWSDETESMRRIIRAALDSQYLGAIPVNAQYFSFVEPRDDGGGCPGDDQFTCVDGYVICRDQRCDSHVDCPQGDDEEACDCEEGFFKCDAVRCLSNDQKCDGRRDCMDNADEIGCPTTPSPFTPPTPPTCRSDDQGPNVCNDGRTYACNCDGKPECPGGEDESPDKCGYSGCEPNELSCDQGNTCFKSHQQCDGEVECYDGTDEKNCPSPPVPCGRNQYECKTGECIDDFRHCDYMKDCPGGEDEEFCPCKPEEYECNSGQCIPESKRCDGTPDCEDETDETVSCPCDASSFTCRNGQCVHLTVRCDGEPDCDDQSDENGCPACSSGAFLCGNNQCIPEESVCDGTEDCDTDELNCCEGSGMFECDSGDTCLSEDRLCDGVLDCSDGFDENQCPGERCPNGKFMCKDGECIDMAYRCDGLTQCRDQSDEDKCPCGPDQWRCREGLCIPKRSRCDRYFDCPDYSDEENCQPACLPTEWTCRDGSCIPEDEHCNGYPDCRDRSDEEDCPRGCNSEEWTCRDGSCVAFNERCDGVPQCLDRSDEENCPSQACSSWEWTCSDGSCIPDEKRCDGYYDCPDYSDEAVCPPTPECRSDEWRCLDGSCIRQEDHCDGIPHCFDRSDEENCPRTCGPSEWTCNDKSCIPARSRCDNEYDCRDYSDEENCPACGSSEWSCRDGSCIPSQRRCDRQYDCRDYSDEENCPEGCRSDEWRCLDGTCIPQEYHCDLIPQCLDRSDEENCGRQRTCRPDEWTCRDGSCIPAQRRCDSQYDCRDYSDEENCPGCGPFEWTCRDGSCIPSEARCDNFYHCRDYSDEENCSDRCRPGEWKCLDGTCIPESYHCDGTPQCLDRSDEENCVRPQPCGPGEWTCRDGSCISLERRCDNQYDCRDYSDEESCPACTSAEWTCRDGSCIPLQSRCDNQYDCRDYTDEENCPEECRPEEWRCLDGSCIPRTYRCDRIPQCPDRSDEDGCARPRPCPPGQWTCRGDGSCIPFQARCDNKYDCPDYSDEEGCRACPPGQWTCRGDGSCIPFQARCDNKYDCPDYSDEDGCQACGYGQWTCKDGSCIPIQERCDNWYNCRDFSDEENCPVCRTDEWTCRDRTCVPDQAVCNGFYDCPDYSDEEGCQVVCGPGEWKCRDGACIPLANRCDRTPQCIDRSDEENCPPIACGPGEWQCGDGACIRENQRCNGQIDCRDYTDENECTPTCDPNTQWMCNNALCIDRAFRCDGKQDCPYDNSDEYLCTPGCRRDQFRCEDKSCIELSQRCNGRAECRNGEDERGCPCSPEEFRCQRDGLCIDSRKKCDGRTDCSDGSDELGCSCPAGEWRCLNGQCIPSVYRCDGRQDCNDNSDETVDCVASCHSDEFQCRNGDCIPSSERCNGYPECIDQSDEYECNYFICNDGTFIANYQKCDGRVDCNDGSDEDERCDSQTDTINLKTYPDEQTIQQTREVVFQCRDEGTMRVPVRWTRDGNRPMPPGTTDVRGRLTIPNVQVEHSGRYYCEAQNVPLSTANRRKPVNLQVIPYVRPTPPTLPPVCRTNEATCMNGQCIPRNSVCNGVFDCADASDEMRCNPLGCEPNEFQCDNKRCVLKTWMCDSDDDCGDESDERNCVTNPPGSPCLFNEFTCHVGNQCIPKSFHCDNEVDCQDKSDETGCSKPLIIVPPPRNLMVKAGETFVINCTAMGVPKPTVIWRLNWGHAPDKCRMTSVDGVGVLTCPNAQPTDQGAYSCEALNSHGSVFATPDCIVQVTGGSSVCQPPYFNAVAHRQQDCLKCFCFGATEECYSADRYITQLPPPSSSSFQLIGVNQDQFQGNYVIRNRQYPISTSFIRYPAGNEVQLTADRSKIGGPRDLLIYFSLPDSHKGQQLSSYSGYLRYKIVFKSSGSLQQHSGPDVIMVGNNITLMHVHDGKFLPNVENQIDVRLSPGQWFKRVVGRGPVAQTQEPASREEIMMVLENIEFLLIRALYHDESFLDATLSEVQLDTSVTSNSGQGQAVYVEDCRCPEGYMGLSCQSCAPSYKRVSGGLWLGQCVRDAECSPGEYGDPANGIPCQSCPCPLSSSSNQFSSSCYLGADGDVTCNCNKGYAGRRCERCSEGYEGNPLIPGDSCQPVVPKCEWFEFYCGDMSRCINKERRCDGRPDCPDGSDEEYCYVRCVTTFTCSDGTVHPWSRRCDGIKDCLDYEDEKECDVCFNSGHRCGDGHCVHFERICDGHSDCRDLSDELPQNCLDALPCDHIHQWTCADPTRQCIDRSRHCDRVVDCPDGSDELYCNCTCDKTFNFLCNDGLCLDSSVRCNGRFECPDRSDEIGCGCDPRTDFTCNDGACIDIEYYCNGRYDCRDGSDEPVGCNHCDLDTMHQCGDRTCIDKRYVCNGQTDCTDGSDEPWDCTPCNLETMHRCGDGTCISKQHVCNGQRDCRDGSDEPPTCSGHCDNRYEFACRIGTCIDLRLVCNGYNDCWDGSDEERCSRCNQYEFQCGDGSCINRQNLCDGRSDCRDGSDESERGGCCVAPYFSQCLDGSCIDSRLVCNGRPDCRDGSDEYDCTGECNPAGSYSSTADPVTGLCQCKELVSGPKCDTCIQNAFYLSENNRYGCIDCFCMGITEYCTSSNWYRQQESVSFTNDRQGFELVDKYQQTVISNDIYVDSGRQELVFQEFSRLGQEVYYWKLPPRFLGDKVTSYGGNLTYMLRYVPTPGGQSSANAAAAVIIYGNDNVLKHYSRSQLSPNRPETVSVPLYEQHWERDGGQEANREHFLMALADLEYILIKATYTTNTGEVGLKEVSLDYAEPRNTGQERAFAVEMCECPQGYQGLSCEDCAIGYTRSLSGLYLGTCIPCECNGHSEECDPEDGICTNCRDNTAGDYCDECAAGFTRDEVSRRCIRIRGGECNCDPRGSVSTQCYGSRCQCKINVQGEDCDSCKPGYFHLASHNRDGCLECWCSGVSSQCFSSNYFRTQLPMQLISDHGFTLANRLRSNVIKDGFNINVANNEISFGNFGALRDGETYYWSLPQMFTGNRLPSYGGNLTITQRYQAQSGGNQYADPDVIIRSSGGRELIWMNNRPLQSSILQTYVVPLFEENFTMNQRPATRADFLNALSSVEAILVRATLSNRMTSTFLRDVIMDTAVSSQTGQPRAYEVEQCQCPKEYSGLSCEQCKPGYYRDTATNQCNQCPCNGREESCSPRPDGRVRCDCLPGYHGDFCEESGPQPDGDSPTATIRVTISEPSIVISAVGSTVQFRCSARTLTDQRPVSVTWSKIDGVLPYGRASDNRQGLLEITQIQPSDSGVYICTASDGYVVFTQNATLRVQGETGAPGIPRVRIDEPREVLEVRRGQTLEVRCSAAGSPRPQVTWSYGPNRDRLPFNVFSQSGVLIFRNAQTDVSGEYYCTASNSQGTNYARIIINIVPEDRAPVPSPIPGGQLIIVQVSRESVEVRSGETVRVSCTAGSAGSMKITWSRLAGQLPAQAVVSSGELQIPNARSVDSGIYVCRITDERTSRYEESSTRITVTEYVNFPSVSIQPDRQTINQGSNAELRCIATGDPAPILTWTKANEELGSRVTVDGSILRITDAVVSNRGMYVCSATNDGGTAQAASIVEVERREPPVIEIYPEVKQTIVVGASALFQCLLKSGIPTPSVRWARTDGRPLKPNTEVLNGGVLMFNEVKGDEEGSYTCIAENDAGSVKAVAILEIQSLPFITIQPSPSPYRVRIGQRVRFECSAQGDPAPTLSWQKLQHNFPANIPSQSASPTVAVYEIASATRADEGTYQCSARNAAGTSEERLQLIIEEEDVIQQPPYYDIWPTEPGFPQRPEQESIYSVPRGGSFELRCAGGSERDTTQVDFKRSDDAPLPRGYRIQDGVLYLNNVDESAAGEYVCIGSDRITGNILFTIYSRIQVLAPPRITLEPRRQVVRPGDHTRIYCSATGGQPITINWKKLGGFVPSSVIRNGGEMMFRGISTSDAGQYICEATNSAGSSEAVAEVVVNEEPLLTAIQRDVLMYTGQTAELRCEVSGLNPGIVQWRRNGGSLPPGALPRGNLLRLPFINVEDSGRYMCEARTPDGLVTSDIITLTVERSQAIPVRIEPSRRNVRIGEDVVLSCTVDGDPAAAVSWSRIGKYLPPNAQERGSQLWISNVQPDNGGVYRCSVTTQNGVFDESYPLIIQDTISTENLNYTDVNTRSVKTRSVPYGTGVIMECSVNIPPPVSYTWSKQGGDLPARALIQDASIDIPDVRTEDAGLYICTGSNNERSVDLLTLLIVKGVIPRFSGSSYITLPTLPRAYLTFDLDISFKPESGDGLILYNSQRAGSEDGDFVSFGMSEGHAEFRFDVGSGPAIIRSATPIELNTWHTVRLSRDRKEGTMIVDDGAPVTGRSEGRFLGLDLVENMYLGSVPDFSRVQKQSGFNTGFRGCISRLVISKTVTVDLMQDAKAKVTVGACETCAGNPCKNSGVCQEAYTETGHKCICPAGFSGGLCENTGEACYPGVCGTGRCVNKPGGFECFCPFGKVGERCERDITIVEPAFGDGAYIAYPTPKALRRFSVDMNFKPESLEDGVLMYCAQRESGEGDFASLAIRNKRLEFRFNTGSGTALIQSDPLQQDQWIEVRANRTDRLGSMSVNGGQMQNTESPGTNRGLNLVTPLFIGGVDNSRIEISPEVSVNQGFHGCVKQIKLMDQEMRLADSLVDSANVGQCGGSSASMCKLNTCSNSGQCIENPALPHGYTCNCNDGYSGRDCEVQPGVCSIIQPCRNGGACIGSGDVYSCRCPLGFAGQHCEHGVQVLGSASFSGDSWVEFDRSMLPHEGGETQKITFEFSTVKSEGLLFWLGQEAEVSGRGQDYVSVAIRDGFVEFSYQLGTGPASVLSRNRVNDGERHTLIVKRTGRHGSIELDGSVQEYGESPGILHMLNTRGNIYIGGVPDLQLMTDGTHTVGFQGCIHQLTIGEEKILNYLRLAVSGINVTRCPSSRDREDTHVSTRFDENFYSNGGRYHRRTVKTKKTVTTTRKHIHG